MKKMLFFITILLSFLPCVSSATTVTENLLRDLGFYDGMWSEFLENSDTNASTWQCGKIGGDVVRYMVNGDVIAYDGKNHVWWHLFTPISTSLPIEALALHRDSIGVVTTQEIVLRKVTCSPPLHVEKHVKQQETTKSAAPAVKKSQVKATAKKAVAKPEAKHKTATAPVAKKRKKEVQKNIGRLTVVSTWELMELYRKQTEGE